LFSDSIKPMAKLFLGFLLATTVWANPDWDAAVRLAQEGKNTEASSLFLKDLELAPTFARHYNLAVLAVRSENWSASVVHLIESAKRTANPLAAYQILESVSRIQNHLLIQAPVSRSASALTKFLFSDKFFSGLLFILFWGSLFSVLFVSRRTTVALWLLCLCTFGAYSAKHRLHAFAVVSASKGELYSSNELSSALATLPPGTLLILGQEVGGAREVLAPFVGWVQSASLTLLN
jgi:hypothetical protein